MVRGAAMKLYLAICGWLSLIVALAGIVGWLLSQVLIGEGAYNPLLGLIVVPVIGAAVWEILDDALRYAYSDGFEAGAEAVTKSAYDDGYQDGMADAHLRPVVNGQGSRRRRIAE